MCPDITLLIEENKKKKIPLSLSEAICNLKIHSTEGPTIIIFWLLASWHDWRIKQTPYLETTVFLLQDCFNTEKLHQPMFSTSCIC